jgi:hypothetical protein
MAMRIYAWRQPVFTSGWWDLRRQPQNYMGSVGRVGTLGKDEVNELAAAAVGITGSTGVLTINNNQYTT